MPQSRDYATPLGRPVDYEIVKKNSGKDNIAMGGCQLVPLGSFYFPVF